MTPVKTMIARPLKATLLGCAALTLGACNPTTTSYNRGLESVHQPVVQYTSFAYDVRAGSGSELSSYEAQRLEGWLQSIGLGYGDHIAIATESGYHGAGVRDAIADVVARHGLLVEEDETAQAGGVPEGAVRLIVRRATASVPGCPDWSQKAEADGVGGTSSNFGCASNSNLAAMIANPEDLVRGQVSESDLRTATSNRAIQTYREKAPTGAGDLKQMNAGGGN